MTHSPPPAACAAILTGLILLIAGCDTTPMSQAAFVKQADQLHSQALASARIADPQIDDYLQTILQRLVEATQAIEPKRAADPLLARLRVHILRCDTPNAFDTGGEHLYLYSGLVQFAQTEEELAALIAHEYAHALRLDVQNTKIKPQSGNDPARIVWLFVNNRLTPQQEQQADALAFRLYARAGWDPMQFPSIYERLNTGGLGAPGPGRPGLSDRIRQSQAQAQKISTQERIWWRKENVADEETCRQRLAQANRLAGAGDVAPHTLLLLRALPNCILSADRPEQLQAQNELRLLLTPQTPMKEPS